MNQYELKLFRTYQSLKVTDIHSLLSALKILAPIINDFFDNVYVMVDNKNVRERRLGLLQAIADLPKGIVDLSELDGF